MSSPIDPVVLLNVLEPILDKSTGGIREVHLANRFVNVMRDARKLVQRSIYLNIFDATRCEDIRKEIIKLGGWNILYEWLRDSEQDRHWSIVVNILQLFIDLPVSIDQLRSNGAPKIIRRLSKRQDVYPKVRNLAVDILSIWKDIVIDNHVSGKEKLKQESNRKSSPSSSDDMSSMVDPNIDLEAADEPYGTASSSTSSSPLGAYFNEGGKSAQNTNTHLKVSKSPSSQSQSSSNSHVVRTQHQQQPMTKLGKTIMLEKAERLNRKDIEQILNQQQKSAAEKEDGSTEDKQKKINVGSKRPSSGDSFGAALSGADEASSIVAAKRPKTVKTYRTTFRSTGLDQEPEPVVKKRKTPAEAMNALKGKVTVDISELLAQSKPPPSKMFQSRTTPTSMPSQKPKPGPAPIANLPRLSTDSNLIGDQLIEQQPVLSPTSLTPGGGGGPPKSTKPATAASKAVQMIESDSFMAALAGSSQSRIIRKKKTSVGVDNPTSAIGPGGVNNSKEKSTETQLTTIPKPQFYKEIVRPSTTATSSVEQNATETATTTNAISDDGGSGGDVVGGKAKRRVRWAEAADLVRIKYFELEEGERAHKALGLKNNSDLASLDKKMEREALEAARKGAPKRGEFAAGAEPETYFTWKLINIDNAIELASRGAGSEEKKVQQDRMRNVLAEIYFTYDMIPDSPKEPDLFMGTQQETTPIVIPLDDAVTEQLNQLASMPVTAAPTGLPSSGASLPPELAQLLQNLNKSGMMPPTTQPTVGPTPSNVAGFGNGGLLQGGPGFISGMGQLSAPYAPIRGQLQPGAAPQGVPPPMLNTGQQQAMFSNQLPPSFGPHSGGLLAPPPSAGPNWNPQMVNMPPPSNIRPSHAQNGSNFRPRGPPPGFGPRQMGGGNRFQGPPTHHQGGQGGGNFRPAHERDRVCPFFLRDRCTFGEQCRYKHEKPSGDSPSSPPGDHRSNDKDRGDRYRNRSPPSTNRFHRRGPEQMNGGRDRDRERDRDYRPSKFRSRMSPTYSPVERYQSSPPAQIMAADSPTFNHSTSNADQVSSSTNNNYHDDSVEIIEPAIPDTPASP